MNCEFLPSHATILKGGNHMYCKTVIWKWPLSHMMWGGDGGEGGGGVAPVPTT